MVRVLSHHQGKGHAELTGLAADAIARLLLGFLPVGAVQARLIPARLDSE
jgi:hypothetical protein